MRCLFRTISSAALAAAVVSSPGSYAQSADDDTFFTEQVLPILEETCFECHDADKQKGGLRLDSRAAMLRGGDHGLVVVSGDPANSKIIQAVLRADKLKMPPKEELFPQDIEVLTEWVRRGMPWPGSEDEPAEPVVAGAPARQGRQVPLVTMALDPGAPLKFDRDIRPILSDKCYACHGPDGAERKADLRLDDPDVAKTALASGHTAIVAGDLSKSALFQRIAAESPDDRMPPDDFHKSLTENEIETLGRWILQGAKWEQHWAFEPIERPAPAQPSNPKWARTPIDDFVLARLDAEGLAPAPEADKRTLIRRATLDLTGLPPTMGEVREFLDDDRPDAYELVIDRLLASPRYGENMARYWLDAARYADTNGYHIDNMRFMWRWRDWVIDAFNQNLPFNEFTIDQLAGDLLPNATLDQKIATGFNRNHMINFEGGAIPEEYRVQYVMDRVDTTSTVWLGLTMQCAQCHDHKYDPITRKEFYQMAAYFNTIPEQGLDAQNGNAVPMITAPRDDEAAKLAGLEERLAAIFATPPITDAMNAEFAAWADSFGAASAARWRVATPQTVTSSGGATVQAQSDWSFLASGANPDKDVYEFSFDTDARDISILRLEAMRDASLPDNGPGRATNSNFVLTEFEVDIAPADALDKVERLKFARAIADYSQPDYPVANAIDGKPETGWAANAHEIHEARSALFVADKPFGFEKGTHITVRIKQESQFAGHGLGRFRLSYTSDPAFAPAQLGAWYANGPYIAKDLDETFAKRFAPERRDIDVEATGRNGRAEWIAFDPTPSDNATPRLTDAPSATYLYREITAPTAREASFKVTSRQRLKIWLNGRSLFEDSGPPSKEGVDRMLDLSLRAGANALLIKVVDGKGDTGVVTMAEVERPDGLGAEVHLALAEPADLRRPRQTDAMRDAFFMQHYVDYAQRIRERADVEREIGEFKKQLPTAMVMAEMDTPRPTFMLKRGQYDQPEDEVNPGTPAVLPPLPAGQPNNRLALAEWFVSKNNPLTPRVTVNRLWQRYYGQGIVRSSEDFGTQGDRPSHPELLDWLASEFVDNGWDVKSFVRMMVTSSTYRQSAKPSREALERDPLNRLYARGPRYRMDAETIRDNALAVSGLLVEKIGGPSVYPYQPEGLWEEVSYKAGFTAQFYEQGHGPEQLYRRSMYTFWKRTAPPPGMMVFDAPNRETCTVRRSRTNTPLQALALMNDPQYVEAARAFAERILDEGGRSDEARVRFAFETATARPPTDHEVALLLELYEAERTEFSADTQSAEALLKVGESPIEQKRDPAELAAWTTVASTILNLDETITIG